MALHTGNGGLKPDSRKYLKGIIGCLIAGVILYAPFGLHLKFSDPGIVRGGLSLACGVVLLILMVYYVRGFLKTMDSGVFPGREKKDGGAGTAGKTNAADAPDWSSPAALSLLDGIPCGWEAKRKLAAATPRLFTGKIAAQALEQGKTAAAKAVSFREIIARKFTEGSLTHARYAGTIDQCMETFGKNLETLAWQISGFDEKEYDRLTAGISSGDYKKDQIDDRVQEDRLLTLAGNLEDMRHVLNLNEQMILSLDGCAREVAMLQGAENDKENEVILEEIQNLIDTTKYYK